jgi:hypothetical protein
VSDPSFSQEVAAGVKGRTAILRTTREEIIRLLKLAQEQIAVILASQPSDYQRWYLPQLQREINRVLASFGEQGAAVISTAAGNAWQAGQELIDKPLHATGSAQIVSGMPRIDTQHLDAMRAFMTERIKNISLDAANRINSELGLVIIGAQSPGDAISKTRDILGDASSKRATNIVRNGLSDLFSTASFTRMKQAVAAGANIRKKWIKSGKVHSRPGHDAIHGQIVAVDEPFWVMGKDGVMHQLMHPHDPEAPLSEKINCGCVCTPTASGFEGAMYQSKVAKPDGGQYTKEELRARAADYAARKGLSPGKGLPPQKIVEAFDPNQLRDRHGRWTSAGDITSLDDIATYLAGHGTKPIIVAKVPHDIQARLHASSNAVLLSRYTADKQGKHPEITAESFGMLQQLLDHGERLYDQRHHAIVIYEMGQPYVAVLKVTKNLDEVYLQSFRRSDLKNVASLRNRNTGGG